MTLSHSVMPLEAARALLQRRSGFHAPDLNEIGRGNFSSVYAFNKDERPYVIAISELLGHDNAVTEKFVADLLTSQGVLYPRILDNGIDGEYRYCISERIEGIILADVDHERKIGLLPDLIRTIAVMNQVDVGAASGYGHIEDTGNGHYPTWRAFIRHVFEEEQPGLYWDNWRKLFKTSCLEEDVFEELYRRLLVYCAYNEPYRHFVHNDCHQWNVMTDGGRITGFIDANGLYGDFMVDIATIEAAYPEIDVAGRFQSYYEQIGKPVPDFQKRLIGARYYKGLDCLRFYAKQGWTDAYRSERDRLLALPAD